MAIVRGTPGQEAPLGGDRPLDYDRAAAHYDATRGASPSLVGAMLEALGPPGGRTLLEVGCGTGNYARAFGEAGFRVIGVDVSGAMLSRAKRKIGGRLARAAADDLPFASQSVDCVVTVNVFHHLPDALHACREFRRVAREGVLHHLTAGEQYRAHWAQHYFPLLAHEEPGEHPGRGELIALMQAAGFSEVEAIRFDYADTVDASFMPLLRASPARLCERAFRHGVSTFRRLTAAEDAAGAAALSADLRTGRFEEVRQQYERVLRIQGDSTILVGTCPRTATSRARVGS